MYLVYILHILRKVHESVLQWYLRTKEQSRFQFLCVSVLLHGWIQDGWIHEIFFCSIFFQLLAISTLSVRIYIIRSMV